MSAACEPLHVPSAAAVAGSQMTAFQRFCEAETGRRFADHASFHQFSVDDLRSFWSLFLRWSGLPWEGSPEPVCEGDECERASFFPRLRLGYVESLLRIDDQLEGERPALTARSASGKRVTLTRRALAEQVGSLAVALDELGIAPGDRVVAIAHNDAAAVVAGLGALAVGATLSTASPDMGAFSILARFAPLAPLVLMCHTQDLELETPLRLSARVAEVARGLPSLQAIIALDDGDLPPGLGVPVYALSGLVGKARGSFAWRRFPFNHPLFILFSSGTTGPPKCIVHGAGGTLLEHLKEHRLHGDLRAHDKLFFYTSCSWMMWNWQLSALAAGAEIVLYAGAIPAPDALWRIVSEERVTVFGCSPAYLQICEDAAFSPARELPIDSLRVVLSTGSILYDHQYRWAREAIGAVPLVSISGGTDIIGCFVLGNPNLPSYPGESQCRSLGMDVQAFQPGASGVGELVCRTPFPSRPLGFHGDGGAARFHDAYFGQNPGVWTHGDWIEVTSRGTVRMHGRSDGVLNVRGMRIGPAEIYRILQSVAEVHECLAVEQAALAADQSRLVLLVVMRPGGTLDAALKRRIRSELGSRGSTAHVPDLILAVAELPVTHSGKRSERAARDAVNGVEAANVGALRNPGSLVDIRLRLALEEGRRSEVRAARSASPADSPLRRAVASAWERALGATALSPDEDFFELGGTSLLALRVCSEVLERTGCELPPSALFEAPTIALMAAAIRDLPASLSPIVPLSTTRQRRSDVVAPASGSMVTGHEEPLFIVHGLGGDVLELRPLAQRLGSARPLVGLRARGLDPRATAHLTVEEMAVDYVEHVRRWQPEGPYHLAGYSFGGLVAFEMAQRLRATGQQVGFVGLLDTNVHDACLGPLDRLVFLSLRGAHRASRRVPQPWLGPLGTRLERGKAWIEARLHASPGEARCARVDREPMTPAMVRLEEIGFRAFDAYRPEPYQGAVTFFRAEVRSPDYCYPIPLWDRLTGGRLAICDVPGDHFTMIRAPHVETLARCIGERLAPLGAG